MSSLSVMRWKFFPIGMEGDVDPGYFDPVDLRSPLEAGDPMNLLALRGSRQLEAESIYETRSSIHLSLALF
jgi:hypothetical protein